MKLVGEIIKLLEELIFVFEGNDEFLFYIYVIVGNRLFEVEYDSVRVLWVFIVIFDGGLMVNLRVEYILRLIVDDFLF